MREISARQGCLGAKRISSGRFEASKYDVFDGSAVMLDVLESGRVVSVLDSGDGEWSSDSEAQNAGIEPCL